MDDTTPPAAGSAPTPRDPLLQLAEEINAFAGEVFEQSEGIRAWQERCGLLLHSLREQHGKLLAGQDDAARLIKANAGRLQQMIDTLGNVGRQLGSLGQQHGQLADRLTLLSEAKPPVPLDLKPRLASLDQKMSRLVEAQGYMKTEMVQEMTALARAMNGLHARAGQSSTRVALAYVVTRPFVLACALALLVAGGALGAQYMQLQDWLTLPPRCASEPYATNLGPNTIWPIWMSICIVGPAKDHDKSFSELNICAEPPFESTNKAGLTSRYCRVLEPFPLR